MTDKQKQAIRVLNTLKGKFEIDDEDYFLLLDFVVGIPKPIINMPFQNAPYNPNGTWVSTEDHHPLDELSPIRYERGETNPQIITTLCDEPSITDTMKVKEEKMSYGDRLIKEGKSPI